MLRKYLFLFPFLLASVILSANDTVQVADLSLKVGGLGSEERYYSFAQGDKVILSLKEKQGKALKEFKVTKLPSNTKLSRYEVKDVGSESFKVKEKGVIRFHLNNGSLGKRICRLQIQRVPARPGLKDFNTDWEWGTVFDTSYSVSEKDTVVGHDTTYRTITERKKVKDKLKLVQKLENHGVEVHSQTYMYGGNEELVKIDLPSPVKKKKVEKTTVSWSYAVSVDQKQKVQAEKKEVDLMNVTGDVASYLGGGPVADLAFKALSSVSEDRSDKSIRAVLFPDYDNAMIFKDDMEGYRMYRSDNIVSSNSIRMTDPKSGTVYLGLRNKDLDDGVTVYINVVVWRRIQKFKMVEKEKEEVDPVKKTIQKKTPEITKREMRVPVE